MPQSVADSRIMQFMLNPLFYYEDLQPRANSSLDQFWTRVRVFVLSGAGTARLQFLITGFIPRLIDISADDYQHAKEYIVVETCFICAEVLLNSCFAGATEKARMCDVWENWSCSVCAVQRGGVLLQRASARRLAAP